MFSVVWKLSLGFHEKQLRLRQSFQSARPIHIGGCIPQAPFGKGEHLEGLRLLRLILECHLLYLSPGVKRNKEEHTCLHTVLASRNAGIVHTVTALVAVEWSLAGLPSGIPHGVAVLDIEIAAAIVHRHTIVSVAGDTPEFCVLVEGIAACCIGDEREEILVSQIVDPRSWGLWIGNYVLAIVVIEMTILFSAIVFVVFCWFLLIYYVELSSYEKQNAIFRLFA